MALVWWLLLTVTWTWLVGPRGRVEVVVGAVLAAGIVWLVDRARGRGLLGRMTVPAQVLGPALLLPWQLLTEGLKVARASLQAVAGRPESGEFDEQVVASPAYPPRRRGHRAALIYLTSFSPNEYVVMVDAETGRQLVHRLVPKRR